VSARRGEWGTFLAEIRRVLIEKSCLARSAGRLIAVRLRSGDAWLALEGVPGTNSSHRALLALVSSANDSAFEGDSFDGDLGQGVHAVVKVHVLVLSVPVRGNWGTSDSGFNRELDQVITFIHGERFRVNFLDAKALNRFRSRIDTEHFFRVNKDQEGLALSQAESLVIKSHRATELATDSNVASNGDPEPLRNASVRSQRVQVRPPLTLVEQTA